MTILSESSHRSRIGNPTSRAVSQWQDLSNDMLGDEPTLEECYTFASFRLYPKQRTLLRERDRVVIGGRALDLLQLLVSKAGSIVSFAELMRVVWPNITVEEANVRVQMGILRKILAQCEEGKRAIDTVPLRGYCFILPVRHRRKSIELNEAGLDRQSVLPMLPNTTIGRDDAIEIIESALVDRRLVTITGPGGIGKTTVAIAAAKRYAADFPGAVRFVDLSTATDGSAATRAIAEVLQVVTEKNTFDEICDHLRTRDTLLILDTCEHIVEPIAMLAEALLSRCSRLRILVTSREALRATGEWTHRLPSLNFPRKGEDICEKDITQFSALQLFVDRVQSMTRFEPRRRDVPAIVEVCRRLDGIPLALEFAAARVSDLGLREIAAHLDNCFSIMTRGRRTALPRHRTLAAAFDWSYGLLSADEQQMLSHLATINGLFSADQAVAECVGIGKASEALYGLYEKSLLSIDMSTEEPMFRLLDITKAYIARIAQSRDPSDLPTLRLNDQQHHIVSRRRAS